MTRRQIRNLHRAGEPSSPVNPELPPMVRTEHPGPCPACAVTRWLHVHATTATVGWRAVRNDLADLGETPAGSETTHHCTANITWPRLANGPSPSERRRTPLFSAIDRHGAPDPTYPLSTRSITTIIATRLTAAHQASQDQTEGTAGAAAATLRTLWGEEDRRRVMGERKTASDRLATLETALDEADAYAETILQHLDAALGGGSTASA